MQVTAQDEFWNDLYSKASPTSSGKPGMALAQFAGPLSPGAALELGCAKGDDAVWLAGRGFQVTAVDISSVALEYAAENARRAGVADRMKFEAHDLAISFPEGAYDLVTASFLHSPHDWPRTRVLARAASVVRPGGHLLIVEHGSYAPWSWSSNETPPPTAEETFRAMDLAAHDWQRNCVCQIERVAKGPGGQTALVKDNIIFLQRIG